MENTIIKYFGDILTEGQIAQFVEMGNLYREWNQKINVVSRKDIDNIYLKHILHSLAIAKVHAPAAGSMVMDLGCGGGFPGIPLAVLLPEVEFKMVDSIGKKITVVKNVAEGLSLKNVETFNCRAEDINMKFDFVVSRAVTELDRFLGWSWNKIKGGNGNGVLYLKGGDLHEEIAAGKSIIKHSGEISLHPINKFYDEEFFDTKYVLRIKKG